MMREESMATDRIGFIGVGSMGAPMAMRIHDAGLPLTVFDVNPAATAPFAERNVRVAATPREVADQSEVVFTCVNSREASLAVALGDDGIVKGDAIRVYVETSTVGTVTIGRIADGLAPRGLGFVDAPISGGVAGARAGTLSTMVSGPAAALDRARPAMSAFAKHIFHVGEKNGLAQVAKLINNMLSASAKIATFEGVVMGVKAGLDAQQLIDILNVSTGRNSATLDKFPQSILPRRFKANGSMAIGLKDAELFLEEARALNVPTWIGPRVLEMYKEAAAAGYANLESMRMIEYVEKLAGGVVVKGHDVD
jgi:3-hydroxyisobutyrate dehydrogenase-like beta-hydroxyacid dehydrogenase